MHVSIKKRSKGVGREGEYEPARFFRVGMVGEWTGSADYLSLGCSRANIIMYFKLFKFY
jgi:hypothetical protein